MKYTCSCGKEFDNPQKFNGHKRHCKIHLGSKYEKILTIDFNNAKIASKALSEKTMFKKQQELQKWINEQHTCEKCGKVMVEKFGSGRFCSRSCANSRPHTEQDKINISSGLLNSVSIKSLVENRKKIKQEIEKDNMYKYYKNPSYCKNCKNVLKYEKRFNQYCSKQCRNEGQKKPKKLIKGLPTYGRHIVYKTVCLIDERYYIGVHKTEKIEFDGYFGSGIHINRMIDKYGKENFIRETLFEFDNSTDAFNKEKELLVEALMDDKCVNIADGGQGGRTH